MKEESGFTLSEVLVVLAIMGMSAAIGSLYLDPMTTPLESGSIQLECFTHPSAMVFRNKATWPPLLLGFV